LIGWHFWDGRGQILKPDGGPVVTVMDLERSFPLDPLPSGWRHRKFWTRSPMTMSFAVKDGVPSMRFETHDSASMLFVLVSAFSYSVLIAPIGLDLYGVSPILVGALAAAEPLGAVAIDIALSVRVAALGRTARAAARVVAVPAGSWGDGAIAVVPARLRAVADRRARHRCLREYANDVDPH
jgi:hypothetical protein